MPRYRITDSATGRTLLVEGDAPPTEADAAELFGPAPTTEDKPMTGARVAELGGDVASEAGGAIAGQMIGLAGGPLAPFTVPLGGFLGGGIGNTIAQTRRMARGEQEGFRFGELLASSAISAIPGGAVAKGASTAARIGRTAAIMGGASATGSVVQQAIDRPEGESIDLGQAVTSGAIGAAGGAVMQGGVEAAKPLLTKLATVFKRTPATTFERAGPEMINDIAKAEGMSPSEVERAIANAINVTPRKPAAQLALEDALAAQQAQRPRLADPAPEAPTPPAPVDPASPPPAVIVSAPETPAPTVADSLPVPRLPAPAPVVAPVQAQGANPSPNAAATAATPGVGGAVETAVETAASKPTITLPDAESAQAWVQRNSERFKAVTMKPNPAGGFDVFTEGKGARFALGPRPDGTVDIIDHIQSLGGVPPRPKGATGGEWNGWTETFSGPGRLLINGQKAGRTTPDQFIQQLEGTEFDYLARDPEAFKQAVTDAFAERARLKQAQAIEDNSARFMKAALTGQGRGGNDPKAGKPVATDELTHGTTFKVKGEKFEVKDIDEDGNVLVQDGPRFGAQVLPPGQQLHADARSLKLKAIPPPPKGPQSDDPFADNFVPEPAAPSTPKTDLLQGGETGGDTTFNLAGEAAQDFTGIVNQQAEAAAARAAQAKAQRNLFDDSAQSGAIDPALLRILGYAAARGATGAAVGAVMADRPEDRAGHALAGALLGVTASPALARRLGQVAFTTTSLGRRAFPEATLPFALREQLILKPGAVAATGHRGNVAQRALETALRKEPNPETAAHEVWQFMTGQRPTVRPALAPAATEARAAVDALSDALVTTGVATGPLADTITASQGRYLRRAYRIFQTPGWRPEQSVIDDWQRAYLAANPKATPQDAQDLALELLDRRNAEQFVLTGSILRQNRDAFTPRKDLDAPTLRLLGEITEPVELLGQTIPRMARLIETHRTQQNLAALGQQLGQFSRRSDPARGHIVQLAKDEEGAAAGPLAGLWTTPELREALESASANFGEQSAAWRILAGATAYSKFAKTVMNPESWVPNGVGALFDGLKNGNLRILANGPAWKDAFAVAAEDIGINWQGAHARAATQAIYTRMQRLGIAGQGSAADFQRGLEIAHGEAAKRGLRRAMSALGRGYAGSENVMRYMNWKAEMARYQAAFPNLPADQLEEYAARVVRATTTNYAMIPDAVRKLSVGGVLGTFVNFPYEQFRHAYNMARIARDDLAQGVATNNPALVRAGAARMAALLTAAAGTGAVAAWSLRENNITPEQDAALRRRFPSWDRNQSLIYQGRDGDNVAYMNQSYLNPQAVILNGLLAANRGQTLEEGAENALKSAVETFGGGSVLLKPGLETLLNRTERGRQISNQEDSAAQQGVDRVSYLADRAYSPGFLNSLTRFAKGYRGETGPDGQVYTFGDAAQRLVGKRINRVNLPYRFAVEARELNHRLGDVASSYEGVRRRELARPEKVDQAYQLAETRRQVVFKDVTRYLADARTLGYDDEKSIRWLRDGGVPADFILSALDGRYTPGDKERDKTGRQLLEEIRAKPEAERLASFIQTITTHPRFVETLKTAAREQARGITEADRLLGALDTDKRAAYLRTKLASQDERQRLEYLHDLARKRLLTADVLRELTK